MKMVAAAESSAFLIFAPKKFIAEPNFWWHLETDMAKWPLYGGCLKMLLGTGHLLLCRCSARPISNFYAIVGLNRLPLPFPHSLLAQFAAMPQSVTSPHGLSMLASSFLFNSANAPQRVHHFVCVGCAERSTA
jgi:hypothetical protein